MKVLGKFRMRALTGCARENQAKHVRASSSNGAMDEGLGKVQKASAHVKSLIVVDVAVVEIHHRAAAKDEKASALANKEGREMSGQLHPTGQWMNVLGRFRMRALTA